MEKTNDDVVSNYHWTLENSSIGTGTDYQYNPLWNNGIYDDEEYQIVKMTFTPSRAFSRDEFLVKLITLHNLMESQEWEIVSEKIKL